MLNDNQLRAAHLMAEGFNISEIARELNLTRKTIYGYKEKEEFVAEVDRLVQQNKTEANKKLTSNLGRYITELEKLAFNSENEKIKSQVLMYLIDRVLGKCTTKADINIDKEQDEEINWDDITQLKKVK